MGNLMVSLVHAICNCKHTSRVTDQASMSFVSIKFDVS